MSERRLFLGRVERVITSERRGRLAQLRPLYEATPTLSSWQRSFTPEDARQEFPNRGFVTWFDPPEGVTEGTVWQFRVEEQRTFDPANPHHDAFKTAGTATSPVEILDVRYLGDEELCRLQVTEEGLELSFIPAACVCLWVDGESWIGPLRLVPNESKRWILDPAQRQQPLPRVRPAPASHVASLTIEVPRLFLTPGAVIGPRLGLVDWAPDDVVLKRVLRWVRKTDRAYSDTLELTERVIDHAVELLAAAGLSRDDHALEVQRLRRARAVVGGLAERQELVESVMRDLFLVPSVQANIAAVKARVRQETENQVRGELEESIRRVAELQAEKARLEEEIASLRATLSAQVEELNAAIGQRLAQLLERPGQALTELAILRAALAPAATWPKRGIEAAPRSSKAGNGAKPSSSLSCLPPSITERSGEIGDIVETAQLRQALRRAFRVRSVPVQAAKMLHAAFLAGVMPVVAGSDAFRALEAYAASVTGGRWLWLPITPGMLEPGDLLGRVDPANRFLVPAPGGLLDLLLHAHGTEELYLVVLEGINRAAIDSYLAPILACYADAWCDGLGRVLPLLHPGAVSPDDPYASVPWLPWPPNVLLAGTLVDGAASVPLPPSFCTGATVIHLDVLRTELAVGEVTVRTVGGLRSTQEAITAVSLGTWRGWREEVDAGGMPRQVVELLAAVHDSGLSLSPEFRMVCARIYAAEQIWTPATGADGHPGGEERALEGMVLQCLVPFAAAEGQTDLLLEVLNGVGLVTERIERAAILAREVVG